MKQTVENQTSLSYMQQFQGFVCKKLYRVIKEYDRSFNFCMCLSIAGDIIILIPYLYSQFEGRASQKTSEILEHIRTVLTDHILIVAKNSLLTINSLLFFYLFLSFLSYSTKKSLFPHVFTQFASVCFQMYSDFIGKLTLLIAGLSDFSSDQIINVLLAGFIMCVVEQHNYDYRYAVKDQLAQNVSSLGFSLVIMQYILLLIQGLLDGSSQTLLLFCQLGIYLIVFLYFVQGLPFMSSRMQRAQISRITVAISVFAMLIFDDLINDRWKSNQGSSDSNERREFDFIFGLFVFIPIAYMLGQMTYSSRIERILEKCLALTQQNDKSSSKSNKNIGEMNNSNKMTSTMIQALKRRQFAIANKANSNSDLSDRINVSPHEIDIFLRYLQQNITCEYNKYTDNSLSLFLEEIIQIHIKNCVDSQFCFCNKGQEFELSREEFLGKKVREQFLNNYIIREYKLMTLNGSRSTAGGSGSGNVSSSSGTNQVNYNNNNHHSISNNSSNSGSSFNGRNLNELSFSFWYFLIDIMQNKTMSFVETIKAKNSLKRSSLSMIQCQHLEVVYNHAFDKFGSFSKRVSIPGKSQSVQLLETPLFDESLDEASHLFQQCLRLNLNLLHFLQNDYLDLNELEKLCRVVQSKKISLHNTIEQLLNINAASPQLLNLLEDYETSLKNARTLSSKYRQVIQNPKSALICSRLYDYSKETCVVFVSLLHTLGQIVKVSKNFEDVVPLLPNEEAVGQKINFMMPQLIGIVHDQILHNFVQKEVMFTGLADYPLLIGVDKEGWSVPYSMKVQVSQIFDQELGASTWIKQIKDTNDYLTVNYNEPNNIFVMSKFLYSTIFKQVFQKQDISKITLTHIVPMLNGIVSKVNAGQFYETILIKPKNFKDCLLSHINQARFPKKSGFGNPTKNNNNVGEQDDQVNNKSYNNHNNTAHPSSSSNSNNPFLEISKYDIYIMKAAFFPVINKFTSFIEIQVNEIILVQSLTQLRDAIRLLSSQMIEFGGFERDILIEYLEEFMQVTMPNQGQHSAAARMLSIMSRNQMIFEYNSFENNNSQNSPRNYSSTNILAGTLANDSLQNIAGPGEDQFNQQSSQTTHGTFSNIINNNNNNNTPNGHAGGGVAGNTGNLIAATTLAVMQGAGKNDNTTALNLTDRLFENVSILNESVSPGVSASRIQLQRSTLEAQSKDALHAKAQSFDTSLQVVTNRSRQLSLFSPVSQALNVSELQTRRDNDERESLNGVGIGNGNGNITGILGSPLGVGASLLQDYSFVGGTPRVPGAAQSIETSHSINADLYAKYSNGGGAMALANGQQSTRELLGGSRQRAISKDSQSGGKVNQFNRNGSSQFKALKQNFNRNNPSNAQSGEQKNGSLDGDDRARSSFSALEDRLEKIIQVKQSEQKRKSMILKTGRKDQDKKNFKNANNKMNGGVANSIHSANTQKNSPRTMLLKSIFVRQKILSLRVVVLLIGLFLLALLLLSINESVQLESFISRQKIEYANAMAANEFIENLHNLLTDYTMQRLMHESHIPFKDSQTIEALTEQINIEKTTSVIEFKEIFIESVNGDRDINVIFSLIQELPFSLQQSIDYAFSNSSTSSYTQFYTWATTLSNAIGGILFKLQLIEINQIELSNRQFVMYYENFQRMIASLNIANNQKTQTFIERFDSLGSQKRTHIIESIMISVAFSLLVVFVSTTIELRREKILRLFSTISSEEIQGLIENMEDTMDKIAEMHSRQLKIKETKHKQTVTTTVKSKQQQQSSKRPSNTADAYAARNNLRLAQHQTQLQSQQYQLNLQTKKKKRTISSTSTLSRFNFQLFFRLLLVCCFLQSYSITSLVSFNVFMQSVKNLRVLRSEFTGGKSFFTASIQYAVSSIFLKIQEGDSTNSSNTNNYNLYNGYLTTMIGKQREFYKNSTTLLKRFFDSESEITDLDSVPGIVDTIYPRLILEQNVCNTLTNYPPYLAEDWEYVQSECDTLLFGSLKQGLIASLKQVFGILNEFEEIVVNSIDSKTTVDAFLQKYNDFSTQINLVDIYDYRRYCINVFHSIMHYLTAMIQILFSNAQLLNYIVVSAQLVMILLTMFFVLKHINYGIIQKLHETQMLLDVIDISALVSNSYVLSYFKSVK